MKDLIKEVALYVGREMFDCERPADAAFFEACLIELSNRAEAVVCWKDSEARNRVIFPPMKPEAGDDGWLPLFTFPPIHDIEAIENRGAEACAKFIATEWGEEGAAYEIRSGEWRKYK